MSMPGPIELAAAFAHELGEVLTAVSDAETAVDQATAGPSAGVAVTISPTEGAEGTLHVIVDSAGAAVLAKQVMASTEEVAEADVAEAIREVCVQAAAAVVDGFALDEVRLVATLSEAGAAPPPAAHVFQIAQGGTPVASIAVWGALTMDSAGPQPRSEAPPPPSGLAPTSVASGALGDPRIDMILDMELPLTVRFGRRELPLKELTSLAPGAVIDLGRSPDDPVDVLVSNQVIARAEVVVVGGNYGVRILDVVSPSERMGRMEVGA